MKHCTVKAVLLSLNSAAYHNVLHEMFVTSVSFLESSLRPGFS